MHSKQGAFNSFVSGWDFISVDRQLKLKKTEVLQLSMVYQTQLEIDDKPFGIVRNFLRYQLYY